MKELPPSPEFDPSKAYQALKSHEGMLAYAEFELTTPDGETTDGILKISAQRTPYRGDTLILTFVIDADSRQTDRNKLAAYFNRLSESASTDGMGAGCERLNLACLDCFGDAPRWFVKELKLFYRNPVDQKKTLLERDILPNLEKVLNCRFQPLEWWPQARAAAGNGFSPASGRPGWKPLKSLLNWWRQG